jgi:hypothetical protein
MHRDIDWQLVPPYFYSRVACCGVGGEPMLEEVYKTIDESGTIIPRACLLSAVWDCRCNRAR